MLPLYVIVIFKIFYTVFHFQITEPLPLGVPNNVSGVNSITIAKYELINRSVCMKFVMILSFCIVI